MVSCGQRHPKDLAVLITSDTLKIRVKITNLIQKNSRRLWRSQRRNPAAFPKAGPIFQQPFALPDNAQTLAGIALYSLEKGLLSLNEVLISQNSISTPKHNSQGVVFVTVYCQGIAHCILMSINMIQQHTKGYQNRWVSKLQVVETVETRNIGAPASLVPVWVGLWHPKGYQNRWCSKWQVRGTFTTRNFGAPAIWVTGLRTVSWCSIWTERLGSSRGTDSGRVTQELPVPDFLTSSVARVA